VYHHNKDPLRSKTREDVIRVFGKYYDQPTVIVGDWNQTPQDLIKQLEKSKLKVFSTNAPSRGTRV
jgi:hypothetical protein